MLKSKKWALLSGIVVLSTVLAACAPQVKEVPVTVAVTIKETQVVEKTVVQTVVAATGTPKPAFSTPHPLLGDKNVREGIAYCTNKLDLVKSVYPYLSEEEAAKLPMDTFIPKDHWAYTKPSNSHDFDATKGGEMFDAAGWKMTDSGYRSNANGDEMSLKFTTTTASFRQTWAAVFEKQMKACGLRVLRFHVPAAWWFGDTTGVARRDYELGAFAWVGQSDPGGITLWACDQIPSPENGWAGQNAMGWCNEAASVAIKLANNNLDRNERIKQYAIVQEAYATDVPAVPLFSRVETYASAADMVGFEPGPADTYVSRTSWKWEIPGKDTIVFASAQEPASMFSLVEDAAIQRQIAAFIFGRVIDERNYSAAPLLYKDIPSFDNGLAVNADVEVKEGDMVVDAKGDVVKLAAGMQVVDASGAAVEFKAGVKMKQLTVKNSFVDGLKWSDGTPVTKADMALSDKINCDKESGATSFYDCERTAKIDYPDDLTAVYTFVPGYQPPTFYLYGPGVYPSQQVLGDGRKLGDVPAKEWATLPEIAECPLGVGPYTLACGDWEKGVGMTLNANPNFVFGAPKTPKIVVQFIADANQAVAQMATGEVDVLTAETTTGLEQALKDEEAKGTIKVYIEASPTWEHIDMGMWIK